MLNMITLTIFTHPISIIIYAILYCLGCSINARAAEIAIENMNKHNEKMRLWDYILCFIYIFGSWLTILYFEIEDYIKRIKKNKKFKNN